MTLSGRERRPTGALGHAGWARANLFRKCSPEMIEALGGAIVSKEARVVEEVLVRKNASERVETVQDTVRRTEVDVERADDRGLERL